MSFRDKRDFNAHRLLRAIDKNTLLSKLELEEQGFESDRFCSKAELKAKYDEAPDLFERAEELLKNCEFEFDFGDEKNTQKSANLYRLALRGLSAHTKTCP